MLAECYVTSRVPVLTYAHSTRIVRALIIISKRFNNKMNNLTCMPGFSRHMNNLMPGRWAIHVRRWAILEVNSVESYKLPTNGPGRLED